MSRRRRLDHVEFTVHHVNGESFTSRVHPLVAIRPLKGWMRKTWPGRIARFTRRNVWKTS